MFNRYKINSSPLFGYAIQGSYYLILIVMIKFNFISFSISNFALLIFYSSIFSQILNLGNNLSLNYFLPKKYDKNFAPYYLYSVLILGIISIFFYSFNYIIDFKKLIKFNYDNVFYLAFFISLNKIINSILLSLKKYSYYFYISIFRIVLIPFFLLFKNDFYLILIGSELIYLLLQFICLHAYFNYYYYFNIEEFFDFLKHGISVFWGNLLYDFLFKVDLLIYSILLPKSQQEELSLSILFFEFFYQIIYVIRLSTFPEIIILYNRYKLTNHNQYKSFIGSLNIELSKFFRLIWVISILSILFLFVCFYYDYFTKLTFYNTLFLILGVLLAKFGHVYQLIFNQIGYPLIQSLYFLSTIVLVILSYYFYIYFFSYQYIYVISFITTVFIGFNVNTFLKIIKYYESNRVSTKSLL